MPRHSPTTKDRVVGPLERFFSHYPAEAYGVYVVEFSDGLVKVGRTKFPRKRLRSLMCLAHHRDERMVNKTFLAADYQHEPLALREVRKFACNVPNSKEVFTGITFAETLRIVERVISEAFTAQMFLRETTKAGAA